MSDTEKLLSRMAAMEAELSTLRAQARSTPKASEFDKAAFLQDPTSFYARQGFSQAEILHLQRVHVAQAMGDQAPLELKILAAQGPQISNTAAVAASVEALGRRLDEMDQRRKKDAAVESFRALISDKSKYQHLAVAYAADPARFESALDGKGDVTEFADSQEKLAAVIASAFGPKEAAAQTASTNAESKSVESVQGKSAIAGAMSGDVPPIPQKPVGVFTQEDHVKLRDEIIRQYSPQT